MTYTLDELREAVRARQDDRRFRHTEGACEMAALLAERHGASVELAQRAALLHDITRMYSTDEQLKLCQKWDIMVDAHARSTPITLHALTGAEAARREFHECADVCLAIRSHTTGRAGMCLLEKIVFIADAVERSRKYPGVCRLRELAQNDLDLALCESLASGIARIAAKGRYIHPNSIAAYNEMVTAQIRISGIK